MSQSQTHLRLRDRFALAFRIVGTIAGFAVVIAAFATSSWHSVWMIALVVVVVIGGALSYHLLTSIVRCPACSNAIVNLAIGSVDTKRKHFNCRHCGAQAWLAEGFYWQDDING